MDVCSRSVSRIFLLFSLLVFSLGVEAVLIDPVEAQTGEVRIVTDLPSNRSLAVERPDQKTFRIRVEDPRSEWKYYWKWWMFRVDNAKGKTLHFELKNKENGHKWKTLHPVYMNEGDIRDPDVFRTKSPKNHSLQNTGDGSPLPKTHNQSWNFIRKTSELENGVKFTHTFDSNRVWVAMRYPFLMSMANRYYDQLSERAEKKDLPLHVHKIGHTENGHRMRVFQIGSFPPEQNKRPTAVLYAREHATDHDASWTMVGALEYLLSDDERAKEIRNKYNIFVIPTLDREAAHQGVHHDICKTFREHPRSRAARNYMNWFQKKWIDRGGRVNFVLDLHNYESNETDNHLKCWLLPGRNENAGRKFHRLAMSTFANQGYSVKSNPSDSGFTPNRFCGRLTRASGGGTKMYYMVNSQAPSRHLTLNELKYTGTLLVRTTARWLSWDKEHNQEKNQQRGGVFGRSDNSDGGFGTPNDEPEKSDKQRLKELIDRLRQNHNLDPYLDENFEEKSLEQQLALVREALKEKQKESGDERASNQGSDQSKMVGQKAPTFTLKSIEGETVKLSDYVGEHVLVLDFWASWCGPCVKSMPIILDVVEKFRDRGVRFVGVNQKESKEQISSFLNEHNLDGRMVMDTDGSVAKKYGVQGIPHTVIINSSGTIRYVHVGYQSGLKGILESDLKKLLNENNSDEQ